MELLKIENLSVDYDDVTALKDINFSLNKGEILSIVGESGSGKSTLLNAIEGFLPSNGNISKGDIFLRDKSIKNLSQKELKKIRGLEMGVIFQEPGSTLNPVRKIGTQFIETLTLVKGLNKKQARLEAIEYMEKVKLENPEMLMNKYPFELSGGMKQRVSIAMAISLNPKVLIADEPTSALDATVQKNIVDEFLELRNNLNTSIVIVTHDLGLANYISDKILVLYNGKQVEYDTKKEVINHPVNSYTKALINDMPKMRRDC